MASGHRVDRHSLVEGMISQERDKIVGPLDEELGQIAEKAAQRGVAHGSGHVNQRIGVYATKAERMATAVIAAFRAVALELNDFDVEEVVRVAVREIDAIRLRAYNDINQWSKKLGDKRFLDTLAA